MSRLDNFEGLKNLCEIFSSKKSKIIELIKSKRLDWKKTFNNYIVEVVNIGIKKNDMYFNNK